MSDHAAAIVALAICAALAVWMAVPSFILAALPLALLKAGATAVGFYVVYLPVLWGVTEAWRWLRS